MTSDETQPIYSDSEIANVASAVREMRDCLANESPLEKISEKWFGLWEALDAIGSLKIPPNTKRLFSPGWVTRGVGMACGLASVALHRLQREVLGAENYGCSLRHTIVLKSLVESCMRFAKLVDIPGLKSPVELFKFKPLPTNNPQILNTLFNATCEQEKRWEIPLADFRWELRRLSVDCRVDDSAIRESALGDLRSLNPGRHFKVLPELRPFLAIDDLLEDIGCLKSRIILALKRDQWDMELFRMIHARLDEIPLRNELLQTQITDAASLAAPTEGPVLPDQFWWIGKRVDGFTTAEMKILEYAWKHRANPPKISSVILNLNYTQGGGERAILKTNTGIRKKLKPLGITIGLVNGCLCFKDKNNDVLSNDN